MSVEQGNRDKWFYMGVRELMEKIEEAGLTNKLRHFNDVLTGHRAPGGYGDPVLTDVSIDGRNCDIYHTGNSANRIFIHIKG